MHVEMEKEVSGVLRAVRIVLTAVLSGAAVLFVLLSAGWSLLNLGIPDPGTGDSGAELALMDRYDMHITNQISTALDGVFSVQKVYWLNDHDTIAPEPDQTRFGSTPDPAELEPVLEEAAALLGIEEFIFRTDIKLLPGSQVRWYLDETIFAVTWQEVKDGGVYTLSEVKIAHPTQLRRFLAGNKYGYGKQYLTTQMAADVNAVVASSGDFYKFRKFGVVVHEGKVHRATIPYLDTCFVDDRGDLIVLKERQLRELQSIQEFVDENHIRFSLSFGPILVRDGECCVPREYVIGEIDQEYPRAAICQAEELHYLLAVANSNGWYNNLPDMKEFAKNLQAYGVQTAYALDGGQTGVIVMNDQMISPVQYGSQRQISDIFYFATALPNGG